MADEMIVKELDQVVVRFSGDSGYLSDFMLI